jgi:hypothetical protein
MKKISLEESKLGSLNIDFLEAERNLRMTNDYARSTKLQINAWYKETINTYRSKNQTFRHNRDFPQSWKSIVNDIC